MTLFETNVTIELSYSEVTFSLRAVNRRNDLAQEACERVILTGYDTTRWISLWTRSPQNPTAA